MKRVALFLVCAAACSESPSDPDARMIADAGPLAGPDAASPDATAADAIAPDATPADAGCVPPPHTPACDDSDCVIPAGCFIMGSPDDEPCRTPDEVRHEVRLTRDYLLSRREVSRDEFRARMGYETYPFQRDHPATDVTWHEVAAFANARSDAEGLPRCYDCTGAERAVRCTPVGPIYDCLGYRHPTEAEWEHAYRAGTDTAFYSGALTSTCGPDATGDPIGWFQPNAGGAMHPGGHKAPNAWGLHDMAGNVHEWTFDRAGPRSAEPATDPSFPLEGPDVPATIRSGAWDSGAAFMRAASRFELEASIPIFLTGFRVARTLPPGAQRPTGVSALPPPPPPLAECSPSTVAAPIQVPAGPRVHAQISFDGRDHLLLVDTGSPYTTFYLPPTSPEIVPGVGLVPIGCELAPTWGRNVRYGQSVRGIPVLGAIGTDWLLQRPTAIDRATQQLIRWHTAGEVPDRAALSALPYTTSEGLWLVEARLDGVPVKLLLDTGTPLTLWIGQAPRPGDRMITLVTESNTRYPVGEGMGTVEIAGEPAFSQPIWRATELGSLERWLKRLHPDVVGILGLASFRDRRIMFGAANDAVLLGPLP